ncbi:MAG: hypothetical protein GEU89_10555 [Kiloniellaceae bacterium]|nr:hypothetical protein [Kiloniellaceae bacterium]
MPLGVFNALWTTCTFGLSHFPAFYLLCAVVALPRYAYSLLPCPEWQLRVAADGTETLLACFIIAIMTLTLNRDRRGEAWTVLPSIGDTFKRSAPVLGVSIVSTVVIIGLSALSHYLIKLHPQAPIALLVVHLILVAFFCMAIPCAAKDSDGIFDCFKRSAALSAGSRLRIVAAYLLVVIPVVIVWGAMALFGPDLQVESLWEVWTFFVNPATTVFPLALLAVIHDGLAERGDDVSFGEPAAVFD